MRRVAAIAVIALLVTVLGPGPAGAEPPPTEKTRLVYVVSPHPDDEFEGWALVADQPEQYPVFVVLTHGEETGMCDVAPSTDPSVPALNLQTGERTPDPSPPQPVFSAGCQAARLDSWHHFLDGMGNVDPGLDQAPPLVGTFTGDTSTTPALRCDTKGADNGSCPSGDVPAGDYQVWAGPRSARVAFDLGDGDLSPAEVTWAIQTVRSLRGDVLPDLPEGGVVGAGYRNLNDSGSFIYNHKDHVALHQALLDTPQGAGPQLGRTSSNDPLATTHLTLDDDEFCSAMCVTAEDGHHYIEEHPTEAPAAWRWGYHQWAYGWLGVPDPYQLAGITDAHSMLTQHQSFWTGATTSTASAMRSTRPTRDHQDVTPAPAAPTTDCQAGTPQHLQFAGTLPSTVCLDAAVDRADLRPGGSITGHVTATNTGSTALDVSHPSGCALWFGVYQRGAGAVHGDGDFVGGGPARCDAAPVAEALAPGATRTWTFTVDDDYGGDFEGATLPTGTFTLAVGLNVGRADGHHAITDGLWYAPQTVTVHVG